jgi:Transmembrane protein 51
MSTGVSCIAYRNAINIAISPFHSLYHQSMTMMRMRLLILWFISFVKAATASTDYSPLRTTITQQLRRYIQQEQDPQGEANGDQDSSSLTPFTHSVQDYYTDPYDTTNDDDDTNDDASNKISILNQQPQEPMSIVSIIWITACISIVLLLLSCILLGTSKRNKRKMQQLHQAEESIHMDVITTMNKTCTTPKSKLPSCSSISTVTTTDEKIHFNNDDSNDIEKGPSYSCVANIDDDNEVVAGIRNTGKRRTATSTNRHNNNRTDEMQCETDTTTSSDTTATFDASSSSSSLS